MPFNETPRITHDHLKLHKSSMHLINIDQQRCNGCTLHTMAKLIKGSSVRFDCLLIQVASPCDDLCMRRWHTSPQRLQLIFNYFNEIIRIYCFRNGFVLFSSPFIYNKAAEIARSSIYTVSFVESSLLQQCNHLTQTFIALLRILCGQSSKKFRSNIDKISTLMYKLYSTTECRLRDAMISRKWIIYNWDSWTWEAKNVHSIFATRGQFSLYQCHSVWRFYIVMLWPDTLRSLWWN